MSEEIPLKPLSKSDIHKLETALMIATLLREDVLEKIRESTERLTWIDSLAVAAGALARARAGMTASQIADDLGRSEATIRRHLSGKTEAAKLVEETYRRFVREGVKIELPLGLGARVEELKKRVEELEAKLRSEEEERRRLEEKISKARQIAEELMKTLSP
ncbi:MAG: transcriptional regulator [Thermoprotei archaeon]|nr:MAG: transcriptional regulator [Thermoprotei archaeon]